MRDPGSRSRRPPARSSLYLGRIMMHTLTLGTVPPDRLAAAVHAVSDRLQRDPDRKMKSADHDTCAALRPGHLD